MKYEYYCRTCEDERVIEFLKSKGIEYSTGPIRNRMYFTIFSDTQGVDELLSYIRSLERTLITKSSIFSKEEMEQANWYSISVVRMGIDTNNVDFTYAPKCPYTTQFGMERHRHLEQINPFVSKKIPKWKNGYNFCSVESGGMTTIFCSDYAKELLISSNVTGLEFMPVLKNDLKTQVPNVSQVIFTNKLPLEAYKFVGEYEEEVCPFCGKINYCFKDPNCDNIRLNLDRIPKGVDAFGSKILFGWGFGQEELVISKRLYNLIFHELKEKPKHFICFPIG